jgi:hypothetical protein
MSTIPGGNPVTGKIPSQKHAPSPRDRDNPRLSPRRRHKKITMRRARPK